MRAQEFVTEDKVGKMSKRQNQATVGLNKFRDAQFADRVYELNRIMMAVASTDGSFVPDLDGESWAGRNNIAAPYTPQEQAMMKQQRGFSGPRRFSWGGGGVGAQPYQSPYQATKNNTNKTNTANFYPLPQGRPHSESSYYSVQHHFPNVYGINAAGVPGGELAERKIQAQQLKSYLYPCEQLLANMLAHIQNLQQLFSLNEQPNHSYFAQYLDNHHIPNFVELYAEKNIDLAAIQAVQANHDQACDRKSRALDTLLALYGEEFSQEALLHFNYYHQEQPDYWAIDNKIRYLLHLVEISTSRSGAFDTSQPHWQSSNLSSLHKKINILLGIQQLDSIAPLSQSFAANQINLVDDKTMGQRLNATDRDTNEPQPVPRLKTKQQQKLSQWSYTPSKSLTLSPAMICEGTSIDAYRLRPQAQGDLVDVYFYSQAQDRWTSLKKSMERDQAIAYVHKFKKIITDINAGSEGFYLLEHILLRPHVAEREIEKKESDQSEKSSSDEFYHCRLSFVFPKWTARFANPAFRQFAEKTIANHLPAHLFPQIYWLSLREMESFGRCYQPWLDTLHQYEQQHLAGEVKSTNAKTLDRAAQRVRAWLEQHTPSAAYWI